MLTDLIPEPVQHRIRHFVDEVYLPWGTRFFPSEAPEGYAAETPDDDDGWWDWNLIESPVIDSDILEMEHRIGAPLPPLFRAWFMYKCLPETDFGWVRMPCVPSDEPLRDLLSNVYWMGCEHSYFRARKIVPFADGGKDVGPLCFDLTRPLPDGDYPVLLFDHELLGRPEYEGVHIAASFADLLDQIEEVMLSFDKPERLPRRLKSRRISDSRPDSRFLAKFRCGRPSAR